MLSAHPSRSGSSRRGLKFPRRSTLASAKPKSEAVAPERSAQLLMSCDVVMIVTPSSPGKPDRSAIIGSELDAALQGDGKRRRFAV